MASGQGVIVRLFCVFASRLFGGAIGKIQCGYASNHLFHRLAYAADGHLHSLVAVGFLATWGVGTTCVEPLSLLGRGPLVFCDDGM